MFKDIINTTALTTETADRCFKDRITGDHFRGDHSVLATARALFGNRLKEGDQIKISCKEIWGIDQSFYNFASLIKNVKDSAKNLKRGELDIWSVGVREGDAGKWVEDAKTALNETGLYELEALEKWFAQSASTHALVYSDQPYDPKIPKSPVNNAKTILILENVSIRHWHLIAALLPRLLGDWFREKPRTAKETELCLAFNGDSADKVQEFFNEIAKQYDFRSAEIKALLNGFESQYARQKVKLLQERAENTENRIRELMRQIGQEQKAKEQTLAELWGYQEKVKQASGSNTMEYFLANQNLYLKSASADMLDFYATAWLTNWDPEQADVTFAKGHCSSWYDGSSQAGVADEDALLLFKAIFIEETVKVQLWSHYKLYLRGESPMQFGDNAKLPEFKQMLPNPHHFYYQCGGGNRTYVAQRIMDGDIVGAIAQCVSATGGLNLIEQVSYSHFVCDLFSSKEKVVYVNETKTYMTAKEAIKYLKKAQEKKEAK